MDVTPLTVRRTGVGTYVYNLAKHLLAQSGDTEYAGLAVTKRRSELGELAGRMPVRRIPVPTRAMYWIWDRFGVPSADRLSGGCDVFHATNFFVPPTHRAKRVVTIHDLSFLAAPQYSSPRIVKPFSRLIRRFVDVADAIMVYSDSTRRDLIERLDVNETMIHVAPISADERFVPDLAGCARRIISEKYGILGPYVLFVGAVEPRKNLDTLFESFAAIRNDIPHLLVVAGPRAWGYETARATQERLGLGDRVRFMDYVPDDVLPALYQSADLFVLPSHYEGFGIPLLEAMRCGCPVVAADNSSQPEVVGDAGILVPATDVDALAESMLSVLTDETRRADMSRRGLERSATFSWAECARRTAEVYQALAGRLGPGSADVTHG